MESDVELSSTSSRPQPDPPAMGQLVRLDASLRSSGVWLGPVWAVVCGIIASGRFSWNARSLLLGGLAVFLADVVWATLWASIVEIDWAGLAARWNASPPPLRPRGLPYMRPGAPGDRATRWLSHLGYWWRAEVQPVAGTAAASSLVCLALGAALSTVLGWQMLALSAAALAIVQLGLVTNHASGLPPLGPKAVLETGLAWLAGHVAFGPLSIGSALMAAAFTLAYAGGLQLIEERNGLASWRWSQLGAALLLLAVRQPVAGLLLFCLLFAQVLLEPALQHERTGAWYVHSNQAWLLASMLVAAFAIR